MDPVLGEVPPHMSEGPRNFDTWVDVGNTKQGSTPTLFLQSTEHCLPRSKISIWK